ncbi:hypothetical protein LBRM_04_0410 [Leishmania braziliensis MHOM/BR/75/M2904]|uniref:Reverse transcriptase domain-containing protein n=1 Tax=Leishmania braziliensis TaxID=5660 RepID=A4H3V7_LEIBR|nr:hypothetical protein LBRM_04_0410 [Leishmania braziliensis MHOM/BR/75/M2904]CAM41518.1 hypothetical protein LBRM_04_0410 [Leishmania braziliensis MHOM/BR/75/M2904]
MWIAHLVPQQRKNAHVSPPPKPGKPGQSSRRSIGPTSCVSKLMRHVALTCLFHARQPRLCQHAHGRGCAKKMVLSRITDTVEIHRNIHCHVMIGKRPGREQQATHQAIQTLIILVDSSKAFDTVDPLILPKRTQSFPGTRLKHWLRNFLAHRYAQAKLGNPLGQQYALKACVPKELLLHCNHPPSKPLLPELLVTLFPYAQFGMYADDLAITIPCRGRNSGVRIGNAVLGKVAAWSKDSGMWINPQKGEALFRTPPSHTNEEKVFDPLFLGGHGVTVSLFGGKKNPKRIDLQPGARAKHNANATHAQKQLGPQGVQLCRVENRRFLPSPHDVRQFPPAHGGSRPPDGGKCKARPNPS